ncbi:MAG: VanZ family protein [Gemmatimonadota bacterium]
MDATPAHEIHVDARGSSRAAPLDTGARLSRALLSYLVVLIASLQLLPFEFAIPEHLRFSTAFTPLSTLASLALFVPYGFLTRRARSGFGQHVAAVILSAALLALALETAQLFSPTSQASVWHLLAAVAGAAAGAWLCERLHHDARGTANAVHAMLLQLPLMGLAYLLLPLLWASSAAALGDPVRLALTVSVGLAGASLIGSIARATRAFTPDRAWWLVPTVALVWGTIGLVPSVMADWRVTVAGIAAVTAYASWRGRWSAPAGVERRYEGPALLAASPFLLLYFFGASVWPLHSLRSIPLVHLGMPTTEAGLALALPLLEMGIAATVLGYIIAEFLGRTESSFGETSGQVFFWVFGTLVTNEVARSFFGYEGASLLRAALALAAAIYGAGLYHLQRAHVKVLAHRVHATR